MKNNLKNLNSNNIKDVKNFVRTCLKTLPDYTDGEENFLICDATNLELSNLLITKELNNKQISKIKKFVKLRLKGKPLNKISNKAYFYGNKFFVNNFVLSPRKETEILVEQVLEDIKKAKIVFPNILDLCCGSGAIGLTIASEAKQSTVTLSDISKKALRVCKKNRDNLSVQNNTRLLKSNLFKGLKRGEKFDIIVSNPPYIATSEIKDLQYGVKKYEPILALDGGQDGLHFYKQISKEACIYLKKNGKIFLEIGCNQKEEVCSLFKNEGFNVKCVQDYSGLDRIIIAWQK